MSSYYAQLVAELGEEGAKERMRLIRANVKKPGYFDKIPKEKLSEISRLGGKSRWKDNDSDNPSKQAETDAER